MPISRPFEDTTPLLPIGFRILIFRLRHLSCALPLRLHLRRIGPAFPSPKAVMLYRWCLLATLPSALAWPASIAGRDDGKFEWTALGDSYASGVGSGKYSGGQGCLRYDHAYPVQLDSDPNFSPGDHIFNNVVCSGAHSKDVELYQFYDKDTSGKPTPDYGMTSKPLLVE